MVEVLAGAGCCLLLASGVKKFSMAKVALCQEHTQRQDQGNDVQTSAFSQFPFRCYFVSFSQGGATQPNHSKSPITNHKPHPKMPDIHVRLRIVVIPKFKNHHKITKGLLVIFKTSHHSLKSAEQSQSSSSSTFCDILSFLCVVRRVKYSDFGQFWPVPFRQ